MGLHVWLTVRRGLLTCSQLALASLFVVAVFAPLSAFADSVTITEETDIYFSVDEQSLVIIYGNSNRECNEPGADPYLWLYDDNPESTGELIAQDDDGNHGQGQCVSSKLYVTLDAGDYRLRAGYFPQQEGLGYEGGEYELLSEINLSTTTTSSTTSTSTTTTSSTTTTTEPLPSTTSSTTSTTPSTTVLVVPSTTSTTTTTTSSTTTTSVPATTTVPTTTTTTVATSTTTTSTTTSSSTTTVAPTTTTSTIPPTTSTTSTTVAPTTTTSTTTTTTVAPTTTSSSSTTTSSTTTVVSTTSPPTTTVPTTVAIPPPPPNDAPTEQKKLFEETVDIYGTPGYEDYVPAGSTVDVATRRTVTAASVIIGTVPTVVSRRRLK